MAWIGSRLKSQFYSEQQFFYQEGDDVSCFFFMTKGVAAFKIPSENRIFAAVDPEKFLTQNEEKQRVFQYFGLEDSVINHTKIV